MRRFALVFVLLCATPALAGPPPGGPPGLERPPRLREGPPRPPPPPEVVEGVRIREAEIVAWVAEHDPDAYRRLQLIQERDPDAYIHQLLRAARLMDRADRDPAVAERHQKMNVLERRIRDLSADYGQLAAKDQRARRAEIEGLVSELFEIRQDERRAHVQELEERIAELKSEIEDRDKDRAPIIEDYVDALLSERPTL